LSDIEIASACTGLLQVDILTGSHAGKHAKALDSMHRVAVSDVSLPFLFKQLKFPVVAVFHRHVYG
jgi:hypothetical protein